MHLNCDFWRELVVAWATIFASFSCLRRHCVTLQATAHSSEAFDTHMIPMSAVYTSFVEARHAVHLHLSIEAIELVNLQWQPWG